MIKGLQDKKIIKCSHVYHKNCRIDKWFERAHQCPYVVIANLILVSKTETIIIKNQKLKIEHLIKIKKKYCLSGLTKFLVIYHNLSLFTNYKIRYIFFKIKLNKIKNQIIKTNNKKNQIINENY